MNRRSKHNQHRLRPEHQNARPTSSSERSAHNQTISSNQKRHNVPRTKGASNAQTGNDRNNLPVCTQLLRRPINNYDLQRWPPKSWSNYYKDYESEQKNPDPVAKKQKMVFNNILPQSDSDPYGMPDFTGKTTFVEKFIELSGKSGIGETSPIKDVMFGVQNAPVFKPENMAVLFKNAHKGVMKLLDKGFAEYGKTSDIASQSTEVMLGGLKKQKKYYDEFNFEDFYKDTSNALLEEKPQLKMHKMFEEETH